MSALQLVDSFDAPRPEPTVLPSRGWSWRIADLLSMVTRGVVDRSSQGWTVGPVFIGSHRRVTAEDDATFQLGMEVGHQFGVAGLPLPTIGHKPRLRLVSDPDAAGA